MASANADMQLGLAAALREVADAYIAEADMGGQRTFEAWRGML